MKTFLFCAGLLMALSAVANGSARATLRGQHLTHSLADGPLLICEYSSAHVRFEILSQNGKCAPFLNVQ